MSEKKGLKQSRLPFQIITSPKVSSELKVSPISAEKSPKTPVVTSRKRKPSSDGDIIRSSKIGRTSSKENIVAEPDPIEIVDISDDEDNAVNTTANESITENNTETTPTPAPPQEKKLRIKIQSVSKRKQVIKPLVVNPDDSIIYLDDEEIQSTMNKKSTKKSEKKKGNNQKVSKERAKSVKKSLNLNQDDNKVSNNQVEKSAETKESEPEPMDVDNVEHIFDDDDNEKSDFECPTADSKIEEIKDRLEESMSNKLQECKTFKIVLKKVQVPDDDENVNDTSKNEDKLDESKVDLDESIKSSDKSTSESEESPKDDNNKELSKEISKLVDNSPQNDDSANKDLHDEFVEIFTDDEKKSPTSANTPNITKTTPKLTPKALARRKDQEAKRIEKELQRQKEKDEKEKQRLKEKEMREEAKRKEREEKEELRKREKEEKEKKRLAELEKKEEEKRQKEEERKRIAEQKEEEKRAKDEERRQKEEERKRQNEAREEEKKKKELEKIKEEERKKKAAQAFTKFFVPKKKNDPQFDDDASKESAESSDVTIGNFMPFQIHGKMRLAPRFRNEISKEQKAHLDDFLKSDGGDMDRSKLYVQQIKNPSYVVKSSPKTWPEEEDKDDEIVIVDELEGVGEDIKEDEAHTKMKYRAKLYLFKENRRPAYYGTWRKKSKLITARRPFAQDPKFFDYEVDSDDEWEEEEPGESLHGSDSEKEKEKDDEEYEVDDDFFVPHGHLSEDEMQHDDEIMEDNSPETQKAKLKVLQQEFAAEMKKKTEKIKPRLIGCIWMNGDEDEDGGSKNANLETKYHCSDIIWRILKAREMMSSGDEIKLEDFEPEIMESEEDNQTEEKSSTKQPKTPAQVKIRVKLEGESVKELIRLVNFNTNNKKFLIKEYQAYRLKNYHKLPNFQEFQVKSVEEKLNEISVYKTCPIEGPLFGKKCWCVKEEVIKEYFGDEALPMPNQWTYILEKEKKPKANANGTDSKKGSREVTPIDDKMAVTEAPQQSTEIKAVPESPKPLNSTKITSFVKSSPKPSAVTTSKSVQSPKPSTSKTPVQNNPITNVSSKVQQTTTTTNSGKKRVAILMSVQRGQSINQEKKNHVINQFLQTNQKKDVPPFKENEVIEIDD